MAVDLSDLDHRSSTAPTVLISRPTVDDGVDVSRLAAESKVLDLNSRYAYLLWCRDFAETSVLARLDDPRSAPVGFVTGYRRPDSPDTLVVWQVAVDAATRGLGVAGRMLDELVDAVPGVDHLETTITPGNDASERLFSAFAERRDAPLVTSELFSADLLGDDHEPEILHRIGPFAA
ncbi:diaminobutyrate acetyltransferase [Pseudonocardia sp. N23]|uniref:diaminobutyrate acetyltransferase n=1 Tax=Pseudonocardia sp. N23 TaxID=1987376 RepID=UPI000BFC30C3|nr:diaminobutyrate acetyltransferase [Pseudonocardia sp. N23]GAY09078.1 L-2,4-diaminobutyric acid acetyltransferase [Pseudonocardia sp. N23]